MTAFCSHRKGMLGSHCVAEKRRTAASDRAHRLISLETTLQWFVSDASGRVN
jgi:hypothetical protein